MSEVVTIFEGIGLIAGTLYAATKAYFDAADFMEDLRDRQRGKRYRVRTTILQAIIDENQTEMVKLRTLRVHRELTGLVLDPAPKIVGVTGGPGKLARITRLYSVPGRPRDNPAHKLEIDLMEEEALSPRKDHAVVLGYVMNEKLDDLFTPPGVVAEQPVGSDRLVIEVYLPQTWRLERDVNGQAKFEVYTTDSKGAKVADLPQPKQARVEYGNYDFGDGRGSIDWVRAIIRKPPREFDINLDWHWAHI